MNQAPRPDEFYVGYLPTIPTVTKIFLKRVIVSVTILMIVICVLMVFNLRNVSTANFEYGIPTQLEGVVYKTPVPHLIMNLGVDQFGIKLSKTILLVGSGKSGAINAIQQIEDKRGGSIVGKSIVLTGYLIYGDGKTIFQIMDSGNSNPVMSENTTQIQSSMIAMGEITVLGEVIDPKCYFGVMKPGEGKPHRSCAIRCIAGGIPPVFHVGNSSDYFIILGENFEPINQEVLGLVGDQVKLKGKVMRMNEWKILVVNTSELKSLVKVKAFKQNLLAMNEGMTFCGTH
jgi:hypothetical protein